MKVVNTVFIIVFSLAAVLQYNDPDPYIWMPIYLLGAFLCYWALRRKFSLPLYLLALAVYVPYAAYLFFHDTGVLSWIREHGAENIAQSMKASRPWIEETREFFGLLLLIVALGINWVWLRKQSRRQPFIPSPPASQKTGNIITIEPKSVS